MSITEIKGDNTPAGILKHWQNKTKHECAREILQCYERIEKQHRELLEIFKITSEVARVTGPNSDDLTLTVRRVRDMAQMINWMSDQPSGQPEPKPMIPVYQEILHGAEKENGDCFRACVATLLGLTLEQVPHFCRKGNDGNWFNEFQEWLKARGWTCFSVSSGDPDGWFMSVAMSNAVYLLAGPSPRFEGELHQVLARGGEIIHDPHPDNTGLLPPAEGEHWEATIVLPNKPFELYNHISQSPAAKVPDVSGFAKATAAQLREIANSLCNGYAAEPSDTEAVKAMDDAVKLLTTTPETEWVRCSEKMPKLGQRVKLFSHGVIQHYMPTLDESDEGMFWDFEQDHNPLVDYSRDQWMPMPQPPTAQEHEHE